MDDQRRPGREIDRVLLLEVGLGLLLFGLTIYLYWIPAAREPFIPRWWSLPLLAGLFFGLLWLNRWRRRNRHSDELHRAVREVTSEARTSGVASEHRPPQNTGNDGTRKQNERIAPPRRAD